MSLMFHTPFTVARGRLSTRMVSTVPSAPSGPGGPFSIVPKLTCHLVQLAREDVAAELAAARNNGTTAAEKRDEFALDPRDVWERMNGQPGDLLYAGEF